MTEADPDFVTAVFDLLTTKVVGVPLFVYLFLAFGLYVISPRGVNIGASFGEGDWDGGSGCDGGGDGGGD